MATHRPELFHGGLPSDLRRLSGENLQWNSPNNYASFLSLDTLLKLQEPQWAGMHDEVMLISMGTLTAFVVVCIGVLVMRYRMPNLKRPVRTPFAPFACTAGALSCGYLMLSRSGAT